MRHAIADAVLAIGVVLELGAVAGTVAMRDAYERAHYAGPATLVAAFLFASSPVLAHFTVRAIREWDRGDWRPGKDEERDGR